MRFNSKSVTLNKSASYLVSVAQPTQLKQYKIDENVWKKAIEDFNKRLDKRPHVTMKFGDFRVDVLKVHRMGDVIQMWLMVKQENMTDVEEMTFTLKGDVYFVDNSDVLVDTMIIRDIMYSDNQGIFTKG